MASGSQLMTTYYAKRIVGDASAAQANKALLQTGADVAVDTWILNRTNRVNTYGIKYVYDDTDGHDTIELYGGAATASAWVQLDTGDTYISGRMEIGGTNDSYKLYVNGSARIEDLLTLYREGSTTDNKGTGIRFENKDTTTNQVQTAGKTYILAYNTHSADDNGMNMVIRPGGNLFIGSGESAEHLYGLNTTSTTENLYATADGTIYLEAGAQTIANRIGIAIDDDGTIIPVKAEAENNNAQDIGTDATRWKTGYFSTSLLVGAANSVTAYNSDATGSFIGAGTISSCLTAAGGGYYLFANGKQYGRMYISAVGTANSGDGYATRGAQGYTTLQLGNSTSRPAAGTEGGADNSRGRIYLYHTDNTSTVIYSDSWNGHDLTVVGPTSDEANTTGDTWLILGNNKKKSAAEASTTGRIRIFGDEQYYHNIYPGAPTSNHTHYLPNAGGWIVTGGNGTSTGEGDTDTPVYLKTDGTLAAITSYDGNAATATKLQTARSLWGNNFDGTAAVSGNITISHGASATMTADSTNPKITFSENGSQPVHLIYTDYDSYRSPAGLKVVGGTSATPAWFEVEGQCYAARFNGPLTGNVTGNCSGSSGSCTGNAATATNADKVDNYHASDLWRKDGGTWNGNANIACTPTANNQEYSFDLGNAYTGTYWHVWSGKNSKSILMCYNDNMNVSVPNGTLSAKAFSGPLTGNVTGNCSGSSGSCTGHAASDLALSGGNMTGKIYSSATRILQWTTSDTDNNADGASWYGLGHFTPSGDNAWICLSNYWGISFRARDTDHVKINGNVVLNAANYTSYAAKKTEAIKSITRSGTTFTATRCDGTTFTFTQQDNNTTYTLDGLGGAKKTEAIKNITRSGTTFTATRCDGTTFTFTQQDNNTNTWRPVQNNLTSTSTTDSLSAAQGKALNDKINARISSNVSVTYFSSSTTVANNVPCIFFLRGFSSDVRAGGIYQCLGGYDANFIAGSMIGCTRSGNTYTFGCSDGSWVYGVKISFTI